MSTFTDYAPYRPPIESAELRQAQENIKNKQSLDTGFLIHGRRIFMNDPDMDEFAQDAYDMVQIHEERFGINTLMDPTIQDRFPGTDPFGKTSDVEMDFAHRMRLLQNIAPLCPGSSQAVLNDFFATYDKEGSQLGTLKQQVGRVSMQVGRAQHAARLCREENTSAALEKAAADLKKSDPSIQKMNQLFTVMEQVAGLKQGPVQPDALKVYNEFIETPLSSWLPLGHYVDHRVPDQMDLERSDARPMSADEVDGMDRSTKKIANRLNLKFENFDNFVDQAFFSDPKNWNKPEETPQKETHIDMRRCMENYIKGNVSTTLSALYSRVDAQENASSATGMNRGNLIIIDGKTVRERLQEMYMDPSQNRDPKQFDNYYRTNYQAETNRMIAAALMAGKKVEAFIPDANGKLPNQPVSLTKSGYTPSADRPITMNLWQRFWNRLGFYKEKAAQRDEYNRMQEARTRVKAQAAGEQRESAPTKQAAPPAKIR